MNIELENAYTIFDPLGIGFFVLDSDLTVLYVNNAFKTILEIETNTVSCPLAELLPYKKLADKQELINKLTQEFIIREYELGIIPSVQEKYVIFNIWRNHDNKWSGVMKDITKRQIMEKSIQTERDLFQSFMDHVPGLIYFKDKESKFILVNKAKAEEHQLKKENLIGKSDFDFYTPQEAATKYQDEQIVMKSKSVVNKEEIIETHKGKRWIWTSKAPCFDEIGNITGTFGLSWDITERVLSETALRESEEKFRTTLSAMTDQVIAFDENGFIEFYHNKHKEELITGTPLSIGSEVREVFPASISAEFIKAFELNKNGDDAHFDFSFIVDQNTKWYAAGLSPKYRDHTFAGCIAVIHDITDRKNFEKQLRENSERLELALLGSGAGLWDLNLQTRKIYQSELWQKIFGYRADESKYDISSLSKLIHPDDRWHAELTLEKYLKGETTFYHSEHRILAKDGSWKWILYTGKVVEWDVNDIPVRIMGTFVDITARKEYETQLEKNLLQQEILSEIAINLNTLDHFTIKIDHVLKVIGEHYDMSRTAIFENGPEDKTTSMFFEWYNENIAAKKDAMQAISYNCSWKEMIPKGRFAFYRDSDTPDFIRKIMDSLGALSFIVYPIHVSERFAGFISFAECTRQRIWSPTELEMLRNISGIISNAYERKVIEINLKSALEKAEEANKVKS